MKKLLVVLLSVAALSACDNRTPSQKEFDQTPRVIRHFANCDVYKFEDDNDTGESWHYVTVCPNATVTHDQDYNVKQGKATVQKQETNVTVSQ